MPRHRAVVLSAVIVVVVCAVVAGSPPWSGPTILSVTKDHGVHLGDLVVLPFAAAALLLVWVRPSDRRS